MGSLIIRLFRKVSSATFLSPVAKTLEALLFPTFTHHLSIVGYQRGFRKVHNITTAVSVINAHITRGLNQKPPFGRTIVEGWIRQKFLHRQPHNAVGAHRTIYALFRAEKMDHELSEWPLIVRHILRLFSSPQYSLISTIYTILISNVETSSTTRVSFHYVDQCNRLHVFESGRLSSLSFLTSSLHIMHCCMAMDNRKCVAIKL